MAAKGNTSTLTTAIFGHVRAWACLLVAAVAISAIPAVVHATTLATASAAENSPLGFARNSAPSRALANRLQAPESPLESAFAYGQIVVDNAYATRGVTNTVYQSVNAAGKVQYVGITNNLARRAAEHLASKGIQIEKLMGGLSRADARAVEQTLIEIHGLERAGGTLINRINSIASSNPAYASALQRGYELLQSIGF